MKTYKDYIGKRVHVLGKPYPSAGINQIQHLDVVLDRASAEIVARNVNIINELVRSRTEAKKGRK